MDSVEKSCDSVTSTTAHVLPDSTFPNGKSEIEHKPNVTSSMEEKKNVMIDSTTTGTSPSRGRPSPVAPSVMTNSGTQSIPPRVLYATQALNAGPSRPAGPPISIPETHNRVNIDKATAGMPQTDGRSSQVTAHIQTTTTSESTPNSSNPDGRSYDGYMASRLPPPHLHRSHPDYSAPQRKQSPPPIRPAQESYEYRRRPSGEEYNQDTYGRDDRRSYPSISQAADYRRDTYRAPPPEERGHKRTSAS